MPCVSSHLDQMVKMPCNYGSVLDKILMVRFTLLYGCLIFSHVTVN